MLDERMPPYDLDAEKAVCGSLLIDGESIFNIPGLSEDDFFTEQNRAVFSVCQDLFKKQVGINQITVASELAQQEKLEGIGGAAYLSHLVAEVPTSLHIKYYGDIVKNLANKRRLITLGHYLAEKGYEAENASVAAQEGIKKLLDFQTQYVGTGLVPLSQIADKYAKDVTIWIDGQREIQGYSTGFKSLDRRIDGLQKGKLYVVAARPSMGKTMFFLNMAAHQAKKGVKSAIFSLEQSEKSMFERFVFAEAKLNRYRVPNSNPETRKLFWDKWSEVEQWPIKLNDANSLKTSTAMTETMALQATEGVDILYFDYINLAGDQDESEVKRIGMIVNNLRVIARTVNIPVVAISQLNRGPETRNDKRPGIVDLRDSGVIEQVADVVMFLYREEFYYQNTVFEDGKNRDVRKNTLEVIVEKNKEGPRGTAELFYDATTGQMADLAWEGV